ncbi:hypothetical protein GCM10007979_08920 [Nocardioides albus]|nr:hypothetical protein GCM10007979_08920 [Nocardioides albus]
MLTRGWERWVASAAELNPPVSTTARNETSHSSRTSVFSIAFLRRQVGVHAKPWSVTKPDPARRRLRAAVTCVIPKVKSTTFAASRNRLWPVVDFVPPSGMAIGPVRPSPSVFLIEASGSRRCQGRVARPSLITTYDVFRTEGTVS